MPRSATSRGTALRRQPTLPSAGGLVAMAMLVVGCTLASVPSTAPSAEPASASPGETVRGCQPIDLRLPSGERIDLTGTWHGAQSVVFIRQEGSCVWWIALSDYPGHELGAQYMVTFRGDLAFDFTLSGEWMYVVPLPGISDQRHGFVRFDVAIETVAGEETLVLRSTTTAEQGGGPYGSVTLDYIGPLPAHELI